VVHFVIKVDLGDKYLTASFVEEDEINEIGICSKK